MPNQLYAAIRRRLLPRLSPHGLAITSLFLSMFSDYQVIGESVRFAVLGSADVIRNADAIRLSVEVRCESFPLPYVWIVVACLAPLLAVSLLFCRRSLGVSSIFPPSHC